MSHDPEALHAASPGDSAAAGACADSVARDAPGAPPPRRDLQRFTRRCACGELVFEEGGAGRCMYVVLEGEVRIHTGEGEQRRTLNTLGPGQSFGEIALLEEGRRTASAVAVRTPTVLVEIDKPRFVYLVGQQPAFALTVMRALARRMEGRTR